MENIIIQTAAKLLNINPEDIKIEYRLLGGMSNYTYVISHENVKYTIRLIGEGGENFVDRDAELYNLQQATKLDLVNETIYFSVETGIKISKYIEGNYLTESNALKYLEDVANVLRKVHNSGLKAYSDFDPRGRISKYQKLSQDYNLKYDEIRAWWEDRYIKEYSNIPFTFTHGDCQRSNFVIGDKHLYLLDWEFSGNNDPLYDVSVFGQNNFEEANLLLPVYLQRKPTEEEFFRIRFYRLQQTLMWYHVALYKDQIGLSEKLKLNFRLIAKKYLEESKYHYEILTGNK